MSQNLPNMLENTIAKIREMVDVNSVIGTPITSWLAQSRKQNAL